MGLFKKIFKPVAKVLDKVIPNEIKPALPYLSAFAPFIAPNLYGSAAGGLGGLLKIGSTGGGAVLGGGLNILGQLSQEGSEGDINALSAGLGALQGAMVAAPTGQFENTTSTANITDPGLRKAALENRGFLTKATDTGLNLLEKGSGIMKAGIDKPFSKEGLQAATLPAATATGDVMEASARQLDKQNAIDAALAEAEALEDFGIRGDAIRNAMRAYGFFTDEEIESTVSSAGYKAGGRVGFRFGGIGDAVENIKDAEVKESVKMVADMPDMDLMDLVEEFEIIFKRKPMNMEELKQFYRENYEMESPVKMKEKIKETITMKAKDGGLMNLGGKEIDLRGGGFVPIGKKEKADDVPARLSKNEFVMTADAVRAAGGGSVNEGAKRMYKVMNDLEARA